MDVDWSSIEDVCRVRSVALEQNDRYVRPAFDDEGQLPHRDNCWLGKDYANQPNVWPRGCDCGAIGEATKKRRSRR